MPDKILDVVIVGGGINGVGLLREFAYHGLTTLLVDARDFCSQTSANSSKMLHGGIRYLENFDFPLVWEALHEKNFWLKSTPHLCQEREFFLPIYKDSPNPFWKLRMGLAAYDALSGFQNRPHRIIKPDELKDSLPGLREINFTGCGAYHDSIVDDVKMGLEVLYDALKFDQVRAWNYHEVIDIKSKASINTILLKDNLSGEEKEVRARQVIFTTGPFSDDLLSRLMGKNAWQPRLALSKGSHLWLKKAALPIKTPVVMTDKKGRIIFVIPHVDKVLIGTTETPAPEKSLFDLDASAEEIEYLLNLLAEYFPGQKIAPTDIISSFAGIRPLVREGSGKELGKVARNHRLFSLKPNIHALLGGKYTTFRVMAADMAKVVIESLGKKFEPHYSLLPLRQKSTILPFNPIKIVRGVDVDNIIATECPRTVDDIIIRRIGLPHKAHWNPELGSYDEFREFVKLKLAEAPSPIKPV